MQDPSWQLAHRLEVHLTRQAARPEGSTEGSWPLWRFFWDPPPGDRRSGRRSRRRWPEERGDGGPLDFYFGPICRLGAVCW